MLLAERFNILVVNGIIKQKMSALKNGTLWQKLGNVGTMLFFILVSVVLYQGWQMSDENFITAEQGLGYVLGIIGGLMLLLLLIYPLRKRIPALRVLGPVKQWFRIHMLMGVIGPSAILYHSNFQLGALNSNVALFCMLIVAGSGLLGRYFYSKIHAGLYGHQTTLQELQQDTAWSMDQLTSGLTYMNQLKGQLLAYETAAIKAGQGFTSIITIPWLELTSRIAYVRLWRQCKKSIIAQVGHPQIRRKQLRQTRKNLRYYFSTVRKVAELGFYTRLFSLWHVLHLPLFVMMLITGIIHVVAVHMY